MYWTYGTIDEALQIRSLIEASSKRKTMYFWLKTIWTLTLGNVKSSQSAQAII